MGTNLSKKLRRMGECHLAFWCPGCKEIHVISICNAWKWNGDAERPTFTPSILVKTGHYLTTHKNGDACWCTFAKEHPTVSAPKCTLCHSFITDGKIQFLGDCTHDLVGQTVDLPDIPSNTF